MIKPYYEKNGIILYNNDCFDILPTLESKSINLVLTDMPYNKTVLNWDKQPIDLDKLWEFLKPIGKDKCVYVFTATQPFTSKLIMSNLKWFKYTWVWVKDKPNNFALANKQPMRYHEDIVVFYLKQSLYNKQLQPREGSGKNRYKYIVDNRNQSSEHLSLKDKPKWFNPDLKNPSTVQCFSTGRRQDLVHPTQKPVELGRYFIRTYTNPGDLILDPFGGSHTFAVAALLEGRRCISIEKDKYYCEIGVKRLEKSIQNKV